MYVIDFTSENVQICNSNNLNMRNYSLLVNPVYLMKFSSSGSLNLVAK